MKPKTKLEPGDIVQLNPETVRTQAFAGCLAVVDEPKTFGAQLCVQCVGTQLDMSAGQTYYRATWDEMECTGGKAVWVTT